MNVTQAIYALYPNAVRTDGDVAYDASGNEVQYDLAAVTEQAKKDACKAEAKTRIAATDWSVLSDVGLANQADFVAYRATLRGLIVNPVQNPQWPTEPQPVWSK